MNFFNPEKKFKPNFEDVDKIDNELEFNSTILSAEDNLINRKKLLELTQNSSIFKENTSIKQVESKSKLQEKIKNIRESLGI